MEKELKLTVSGTVLYLIQYIFSRVRILLIYTVECLCIFLYQGGVVFFFSIVLH